MRAVLSAVAYCHNLNIMHRDLKLDNLLFDSQEKNAVLKVIDFGTSMIFGDSLKSNKRFGTVMF